MSTQLMTLPINIPWKLIAVSPEMMFKKRENCYPISRGASIALYGYEPPPEDLDHSHCDEIVTFFKVTVSVTGLQLSKGEVDSLLNNIGVKETDHGKLTQLAGQYWACYGVLVNVAVFPKLGDGKDVDLWSYPHIVDFEPKKRDLYQSATETAEILTASRSQIQTDKSLASLDSSEVGLNFGVEVPLGSSGATGTAGVTPKWGSSQNDTSSTNLDSSRERREIAGSTTNISQMYNLITGYHAGMNRVAFYMEPRPHTLSATNRRTFINGVRQIEGMQDFFLIVTRPKEIPKLCLNVTVETGLFPETVGEVPLPEQPGEEPPVAPPTDPFDFANWWLDNQGGGDDSVESVKIESPIIHGDSGGFLGFGKNPVVIDWSKGELFGEDWELADGRGDDGHPGVKELLEDDDYTAQKDVVGNSPPEFLEGYNYQVEAGRLVVTGRIPAGFVETYHRSYRVYKRKRKGKEDEMLQADPAWLVIAQRNLDACVSSGEDGCIRAEKPFIELVDDLLPDFGIVDELFLPENIGPGLNIDPRFFYHKLKSLVTGSPAMPTRRPIGTASLLDTDYFKYKLMKLLPAAALARRIEEVEGLPESVLGRIDRSATVFDLLRTNLAAFSRQTGIPPEEVISVRRKLLGLPEKPRKPSKSGRSEEEEDLR